MTIRASELLNRAVVEGDVSLGVVVDIRVAKRDGGLEVVALLVGPRRPVRLLGPHEADRSGAWVFDRLLALRDRKVFCVPWSEVVEIDEQCVRVSRKPD